MPKNPAVPGGQKKVRYSKLKKLNSAVRIAAMLLAALMLAPLPAAAGDTDSGDAGELLVYKAGNSYGNIASGSITLTQPEKRATITHYNLYWGNKDGRIPGYTALKPLSGSGDVLTYNFENTLIPEGTTRIIACAVKGGSETEYASAEVNTDNSFVFGELKYTLGILSDIYIPQNMGDLHVRHFRSALSQIAAVAPGNLGLLTVGDNVDGSNDMPAVVKEQYSNFLKVLGDSEFKDKFYPTIGNHDLDYGQEALRDHIKGMPSTKFVITNANLSPTLENCFSPYVSIPIKGTSISVGVIGLADLQTTDVRRMTGISWKLPDEEDYKGITDRFRLHHNTINVILSHLGYGNDLKMMKYSPNIDVILGGHTHVMLPSGHLRTGTLLSHTGHRLSHVGVTEIIFSTEHPVSILSKSTRAVSLSKEIPNDPEVKEIVRRFSGNPLFNQQVGVAGEEITHVTIGILFCKAIQQASHSDIAIYNRGGVRSKNHLNKGPVTIRDIYELEPFREKIVT